MAFGQLTPEMEQALFEHLAGKSVWDLGAGHGERSLEAITKWGAKHVTAVEPKVRDSIRNTQITWISNYFNEVPLEDIEVALVFWPQNNPLWGLIELLRKAQTIVYLGTNVNGGACGHPALYRYLQTRTILGHIPHRQNSFTIYGDPLWHPRAPTGEEYAGINNETMLSFAQAEQEADRLSQTI